MIKPVTENIFNRPRVELKPMATINPTRESVGDQCVEFNDIGWKGYCTLLRLRGDHSMPRMVYLDGTVWLMSPAFPHERLKKRLGRVVEVIVDELDFPCIAAASASTRDRHRVDQTAPPLGPPNQEATRPPASPRSGLTTKPNNIRLELVPRVRTRPILVFWDKVHVDGQRSQPA